MRQLAPRLGKLDTRSVRPPAKEADSFYLTPEYKRWRKLVIARAGGMCEQRGCGRAERRMFADHIKEIKDGGSPYDPANGQCLCGSHHTLKTVAMRARRMNSDGG